MSPQDPVMDILCYSTRRRKVSISVSNAKVATKKTVGKQTNSKSRRRKHSYPLKRNCSPISTEDESQEDSIFVESKENYFAPVTRSSTEQIPTAAPKLKYVTFRRKLRNCKIVSNQVESTQLQMKNKVLLGSLTESSESSICFDKPKGTCRNAIKAANSNLNPSFTKKLGRSPLQTSTPSCTRKLKIKEPSRCIISFNSENEEDCVWKTSVEPYFVERIGNPSAVEICCSQRSNTSDKELVSTEFSNHLEFVGLSQKKLDGICGFETEHQPVAFVSSVQNLEHVDLVTSHSFQTPRDDLYHTLHSTFNQSKELFSDVTEVSESSPEADLINETDDTKRFVRKPSANCTLNLDLLTKQENCESKKRAYKLDFQPVVQLDYFSVHKHFHKSKSLSSAEDDSSQVSSSRCATGKKQQFINRPSEKLAPQKSTEKSFNGMALQPAVLLSPLELEWHLPEKKGEMRNPVKRNLGDEHKCSFKPRDKERKYTDDMNLKSSRSAMHLNSQEIQLSMGSNVQGKRSDKGSTAESDSFKPIISQQNRKTISNKNGCLLKRDFPSGQKNHISGFTSNVLSKQSSCTGSVVQKTMDPFSPATKSAERSTVDLCGHPKSQVTEGFFPQSTFVNYSSFSSPLGSRNWSRFKAAHSVHKRKKVIVTPLKSICTMSNQSTPESKYLLRKGNCNDQSHFVTPQNKLVSMANFSATPISNRLRRSILSRSSLVENWSSVILQSVFLTDEEKVYCECHQNGPVSFKECIPFAKLRKCKKIGEGVFGEVYQTINDGGKYVVFKIIPIEGEKPVNGEPQKKFEEILPEIIISKKLSQLSEESDNCTVGFISIYSVHCVKDSYPLELLKAWDKYNRTKTSENDRPDELQNEQLYIIFEFEYGGCDLESMRTKIPSLEAARSILYQVTASLAVAETALNFEHRDLHWGNVLIKETDIKQIEYKLCGKTFNIDTHGFMVNIIDYTLSRMGRDDAVHFCDLSSENSFFHGQGDYQFDVYRKMKEENHNNWAEYNPHTNVLWLHYLADKMLNMQYKKRATKSLKIIKEKFMEFVDESLEYQCAVDLLSSSRLFQ
uniref:serine/threonine-protein kinase haspin isoform X2 n=1 Tax=Pristiophorus japonicus TaxID=55135 RepID=UPI00398EB541